MKAKIRSIFIGITIAICLTATACNSNPIQTPISKSAESFNDNSPADVSSQENEGDASGLYLFSPIQSTETYLMDANGTARYTWESEYTPGNAVYLLENGNLLRTGSLKPSPFEAGGSGGVVQEIAPDSSVIWEFQYANERVHQHHDVEQLPNGNVLMIAWERKTGAEAISAGRDPNRLSDDELWLDHIIEVNPTTNQIVWKWHIWDHLVQDYDAGKPNYGVVADYPELIDLNFTSRQPNADWTHINSIDYNADLGQILLSVHGFSEIWIINHNTTTEEAAGEAGDLLYRWGNPQAYGAGNAEDQQLFTQHDAQWIPTDYPGGSNILIFNNGSQRVRAYSSVDEIIPPLNSDGLYAQNPGEAYGPAAPTWSYVADNPSDFYADHISGIQRLPDGNTLICSGTDGRFFEVTHEGEIVWQYAYGDEVFRLTEIASNHSSLATLNLQPGKLLIGNKQGNRSGDQPTGGNQQGRAIQGQEQQGQPQNGGRLQIDFAAAAAKLGITEEVLRDAFGVPFQGPPDFSAIAAQLGISEEVLKDALGIPVGVP